LQGNAEPKRTEPQRRGERSVAVSRTRRLAAVWFADIVGYTALSNSNEDAALEVVDEFQRLVRQEVGEKGRVVKFLGDGALSIFDSAQRAIESAIRLRDAFEVSPVARAHGCTLSVGVHMGEVVAAEDGDVYGEGVNIASRIEGVATSGQVLVSEDVYRLIQNRPGFDPHPFGEHVLKGVARPMPLYLLGRPGEHDVPARKVRAPGAHRRAVAVGTAAGVVGFVALSIFVASAGSLGEPPTVDAPSDVSGGGDLATEPPVEPAPFGDGIRDASPVGTERAALRPAGATPLGAPSGGAAGAALPARGAGAGLAVLVSGDGPGVQFVEQAIVRSFGPRSGVRAADASALARRSPDAVRAALQGNASPIVELARGAGLDYVVLGRLSTQGARDTGRRSFTGSADLGLRLLRVSTGEVLDDGAFTVGTGRTPGPTTVTELAARTEAAQAVGRLGATAVRAWLVRHEPAIR
jgi:class 3 adenylate cyclase